MKKPLSIILWRTCFFLLLVFASNLHAEVHSPNLETLVLDDAVTSTSAIVHAEYLYSDSILEAPPLSTHSEKSAANWLMWDKPSISLLGEQKQLWIHLRLKNQSAETWFLMSDFPEIGKINAYIRTQQRVLPLEKLMNYRVPIFAIPPLKFGSTIDLYVSVDHFDVALVPLRFFSSQGLQQWNNQSNLGLGVFFGFGCAVVLLSLVAGLGNRNPIFLMYSLFQTSTYTYAFVRFGMFNAHVDAMYHGRVFMFFCNLSLLFSIFFVSLLLELPQRNPAFWRKFRVALLICTLYILFLLSDLSKHLVFMFYPIMGLMAIVPLALVIMQKKARLYIQIYAYLWATLVLVIFLLNLNFVGGLPTNWLTTYGQLIIFSFASLLISALMGIHFSQIQKDKSVIHDRLLSFRYETKKKLESEIRNKTYELNNAVISLQSANRLLNEKSLTDPLTNIHNRRYFDEAFLKAIARAAREGSFLSLAILDIDHFKSFNDRFGHLVGDDCLRMVSQILSKNLQRPDDLLTRFGGEEFALLLPSTHHQGAMLLIDELRKRVESFEFKVNGKVVPITLSGGCTTWKGRISGIDGDFLIRQADKALYEAKLTGRNKICSALSELGFVNIHQSG